MTRPRSIVVPMVVLVIATALIVTLVQFVVTFRGPPPGSAQVAIERIAEALRTGREPAAAHGHVIVTHRDLNARIGRSGEHPAPERDAAIAAMVPVPASQLRGYYQWPVDDPEQDVLGGFTIAMRSGNGWTVVSSPPPPALSRWHMATLSAMLATLCILSLGAWAFARRISRPMRRLADAAKRARLGAPVAIAIEGPREVRELAGAMAAMQTRILQQAENRTAMLAAMAHDIGTPLSRLAFWIEQLPDAARDRAGADIDEMRAMLSATLRFTRDDRTPMNPVMLDLGSAIESLADDMATTGTPVSVVAGPRVVLRADSAAIRALFSNLIGNAVRYGERARLSWDVKWPFVVIDVDDDGPGFDPSTSERLFAPFVRGETSRNRATGGMGLGLAIVRGIVDFHEGDIALLRRNGGGGRVRVRLPIVS